MIKDLGRDQGRGGWGGIRRARGRAEEGSGGLRRDQEGYVSDQGSGDGSGARWLGRDQEG